MRLVLREADRVAEQHPALQRMLAQGGQLSGMVRVCLFHPEQFGLAFMQATNAVLHEQPAYWTQGERELFAAFVSSLNQCRY
jgi:alkylhydroperoxidase family enzyme